MGQSETLSESYNYQAESPELGIRTMPALLLSAPQSLYAKNQNLLQEGHKSAKVELLCTVCVTRV